MGSLLEINEILFYAVIILGNTTPTLFDITIQVSMASRVGCVGENGAGKSTMIKVPSFTFINLENNCTNHLICKVLTGEVVPQTGEVWKHPNARVAYVAQHAFHHIENHLKLAFLIFAVVLIVINIYFSLCSKTANEYIRWRYSGGEDKESLVKVS